MKRIQYEKYVIRIKICSLLIIIIPRDIISVFKLIRRLITIHVSYIFIHATNIYIYNGSRLTI